MAARSREGSRGGVTVSREPAACLPLMRPFVVAAALIFLCGVSVSTAATSTPARQELRLVRTSKKACADKDDVVRTHVSYKTTNGGKANALSFKIELDGNKEWKIVKHHEDINLKRKCMLHFYHVAKHYISYVCASMTGQLIVPPVINQIVVVFFKARTSELKSLSLIPNPHLVGTAFKYTPAQTMSMPGCSTSKRKARQIHVSRVHAAASRRRRGKTSAVARVNDSGDDDDDGAQTTGKVKVADDDDDHS